jgi:hypothetical protein
MPIHFFSPQVKNKPYRPREKYAFILENGAVLSSNYALCVLILHHWSLVKFFQDRNRC